MSDQDIFSGQSTNTDTPTESFNPDTLLDSIKNDSGQRKYANLEEALKALQHSQEYIPTLKTQLTEKEQRLAELQQEQAKINRLEELVEQLAATQQQGGGGSPSPSPTLDQQAVVSLVQQTLSQTKQQEVAEANSSVVAKALVEKFGDKAAEVATQKAAELGIQPIELKELAKKSPALVLNLFETQQKTTPNFSTSSVRVPPVNAPTLDIKPPEKSLLSGANAKEQAAYLKQIRESVYAKYGVTP
jgi:hypothetical protein